MLTVTWTRQDERYLLRMVIQTLVTREKTDQYFWNQIAEYFTHE